MQGSRPPRKARSVKIGKRALQCDARSDVSPSSQRIRASEVVEVVIGPNEIEGSLKNPQPDKPTTPFASVFAPGGDPKLSEELYRSARWLRVFTSKPVTLSREQVISLL